MGRRRDRLNKRQKNQILTRRENSVQKSLAQERREVDIRNILSKGEIPYTPGVMSWLSDKLNKKASRITQEDVKKLLD